MGIEEYARPQAGWISTYAQSDRDSSRRRIGDVVDHIMLDDAMNLNDGMATSNGGWTAVHSTEGLIPLRGKWTSSLEVLEHTETSSWSSWPLMVHSM